MTVIELISAAFLGMGIEKILLLFTFGLGVVLSAIDLRISMVIVFVLLAAQLGLFYKLGYDVTLTATALLVALIIMSLSIFLIKQKETIIS